MYGLSPAHLLIVLFILLILVGPGKLPETGAAIGKAVRSFKDAVDGTDQRADTQANTAPAVSPALPLPAAAAGVTTRPGDSLGGPARPSDDTPARPD
jgi:sec-independent protein translocase protein TatA